MDRPADARRSGPAWRAAASAVSRLPARLLMLVVQAYRLLLKPWLGNACRFEPTCSAYTLQALQRHGASGGVLLGGWRLMRCQPWCDGGCDPVPDHHPLRGLFTRFTAAAPASQAHTGPDADPANAAESSAQGRQQPTRLPSSSRAPSP